MPWWLLQSLLVGSVHETLRAGGAPQQPSGLQSLLVGSIHETAETNSRPATRSPPQSLLVGSVHETCFKVTVTTQPLSRKAFSWALFMRWQLLKAVEVDIGLL